MNPSTELTKELVEEWLRKCRMREMNIFNDTNEIITLLSTELLRCWEEMDKEEKD